MVAAILVLTVGLMASYGQAPAAPEKPKPAATEAAAVVEKPELDELEKAWATIYSLQRAYADVLQRADSCASMLAQYRGPAAQAEIQKAESDLKAKIEARHPGYDFDLRTGTLTKRPETKPPTK
jgi:hypothetical protein